MALPNAKIDWERLKPRILRDLGNGLSQQAIRQGLAEDVNDRLRVTISKSQLETRLKHWGYRNSLSVIEWRRIIPRIKKRRDAGKRSQLIVNGFIFSHAKVSKAVDRYHLSIGEDVPPAPMEGLDEDDIVIQTPPSSPDLSSRPPGSSVPRTRHKNTAALLRFPGRIWPQTDIWRDVELLVGEFVAQFVVPNYQQAGRFLNVYNDIASHLSNGGFYSDHSESVHIQVHKASSQTVASEASLGFRERVTDSPCDVLRASRDPHIHRIFVETLLVLFFGLFSNPTDLEDESVVKVMEGFAWDELIPQLKTLLSKTNSDIAQAIIRGLFTLSIAAFNLTLLKFSCGLGADPTWDILDPSNSRGKKIPNIMALCTRHWFKIFSHQGTDETIGDVRELVRYLLSKGAPVTKHTLLWIIKAQYYTVAEDIIRFRSTLEVDFVIESTHVNLEFSKLGFPHVHSKHHPLMLPRKGCTPLALALTDHRQSIEKLSLLRCLLERNAKPDLDAMTAAVKSKDVQAIILLHKNGAPLDGCNSHLDSPLLTACWQVQPIYETLDTLSVLLILGASPNAPADRKTMPPLHHLVYYHPVTACDDKTTEAMKLLIMFGADINYHASESQFHLMDWEYRKGCYSKGGYNHEPSQEFPETILELAISKAKWPMASQLLSLGCELTGREVIFFTSTLGGYTSGSKAVCHDQIRQFFRAWAAKLAKAQPQTHNHRWSKASVFETAIKNGNQEMIMASLDVGMEPSLADIICMLRSTHLLDWKVPLLARSTQMRLIAAARYFQSPITDVSIFRLLLKGASREVIQYVLDRDSNIYDSKGLCIVIARYITKDNIPWSVRWQIGQDESGLGYPDMREISMLISRRCLENSDEVWENTAVMMAVRAGRIGILGLLTGSGRQPLDNTGLIPGFLLKNFFNLDLRGEHSYSDLRTDSEENFFSRRRPIGPCLDAGNWVAYCEMDDPPWRCSPLAVAAAASAEFAERAIKYLLSCNYQPDGWTVLVASAQGRLGILKQLSGLECWPQILRHDDRPDWCPASLQMAVANGHVDVVEFIIHAGLGNTFHAHDLAPCRPCRNILLGSKPSNLLPGSKPSRPNKRDRSILRPRTTLQHAVSRFKKSYWSGDMSMISMLVNAGACVNAPAAEDYGATALQIASMRGYREVVEYLLDRGADPNAPAASKHGRTALQGAAEGGHEGVVERLLRASASKDCIEDYAKAFAYAKQNSHKNVAELLCKEWRQGEIKQTEELFHLLLEEWEVSSADDSDCEVFDGPSKDDSEFEDLEERIENWHKSFED